MAGTASPARSGFRYVYLAVFFALLAGFFHPFISGSDPGAVIAGMAVLSAGLAGGVLLYKAVTIGKNTGTPARRERGRQSDAAGTSEKRRGMLLAGGFVLVAVSVVYIYQLTGRV